MTIRPLLFILLVIGILGPACGGGGEGGGTGPSPSRPIRLRIARPPSSQARNRQLLPQQPIVRIEDESAHPYPQRGAAVTVALFQSPGALHGTTTLTTDSTGQVEFTDLVLQGVVGAKRLLFSTPDLIPDTSLVITLAGGEPASMPVLTGQGQTGQVGNSLPEAPGVVVRDADQNPVAGVALRCTILSGGGVVTTPQPTSAADGRAGCGTWNLGSLAGTQRLGIFLIANPLLADTLTATALPGAPTNLRIMAGNAQQGPVARPLPIAPVVRVEDYGGNPVAGVPVSFGPNLGGTVEHDQVTSDGLGLASPGIWTLGTAATTQVIDLGAASSHAQITASALPGIPAKIVQVYGTLLDSLWLPSGYTIGGAQYVVIDSFGNGHNNIWVKFAVSAGTVTPDSSLFSYNRATIDQWHLGPASGPQVLTVTAEPAVLTQTVLAHAGRILTKVQGDSQHVVVNSVAPIPMAVRVTDSAGVPIAGVPVTFSALSGHLADSLPVVTDQAGLAVAATWTVGTHHGSGGVVVARSLGLDGSPAVFSARIDAGPPTRLLVAEPAAPSGFVGQAVPGMFWASVQDQYGNGVAGVPLRWTVTEGGGSLTQPDSVSREFGVARVTGWILGTTPGSNRLVLTSPAMTDSAVFATTAVVGPAAVVALLAGDGQTGPIRQALPIAPRVRVTDPYGHVMVGAQVDFSIASGAGRVSTPSALTDSAGEATGPSWTLGPYPGTQTLRAAAGPNAYADFHASAVAPPPASMTMLAGTGQSVRAGASVPIPLAVRVQDVAGLPSAGITVNYTITQGGGSLTATTAITDTDGVARLSGWVLGSGPNAVGASILQLPGQAAGFSATGQPQASAFDITLVPVAPLSAGAQSAFNNAVARWTNIILGDVPDQPLSLPANTCFGGQPAFSGTVDDLLVYVLVVPIDGAGGVLGGTGVCAWRAGTGIPAVAVIELDQADLTVYPEYAPDVVLHEMGHALGIGSGWSFAGLVLGAGGLTPIYYGPGAELGYWMVKGARGPVVPVPVENSGPAGTRDVHWAENALHSELMTPYIDYPPNPLSLVTALSLQDLGYQIDENGATLGISFLRLGGGAAPPLRERPWTGPTFEVTPEGRLIPR